MPWKETRIMDQRLQFLASYQKEEMSVADLCRAYGISRPTAYRWINRYNETGPEGLVDRSSRPHPFMATVLLRSACLNALMHNPALHGDAPTRSGVVSRIDLSQVRAICEAAM